MTQSYTSIPDTTDQNYWELKNISKSERSKIFVPRDKELHKKLLSVQWEKIQRRIASGRQLDVTRIKKR